MPGEDAAFARSGEARNKRAWKPKYWENQAHTRKSRVCDRRNVEGWRDSIPKIMNTRSYM